MGMVVNLNRFRKRKAREAAQQRAAENRARHGRSKAEKERQATLDEEARRKLDRLRREPAPDEAEP